MAKKKQMIQLADPRKGNGQAKELPPLVPLPIGAAVPEHFALRIESDEGDLVRVVGVNDQDEHVDIAGIATVKAQSDNNDVVLAHTPEGMSIRYLIQGDGKANMVLTVSYSDGSFAFSALDPCDVVPDATRRPDIQHGEPTIVE